MTYKINPHMKQYLLILILLVIFISKCTRQTSPRQEISSDKLPSQEISSDTFIEISLEGGEFYGGINPVTENKKVIKSDGEIVISYKQLYTPSEEKTLFTSRDKVEGLTRFIRDHGFFAMKDIYDCDTSNKECQDRKNHYPPAVPLKISVTFGNSTKEVIVTVYEKGMVNYPEALELIVKKIDEVINQAKE